MWFFCALMTALGWGIADIFYKKGADPNEKYSHLKTCIFCGLVFGIHAIFTLLITKNLGYDPINIIKYAPVSLCYILSMFLVFYGIKYIEDSIGSPVENSSGSITAILCFLFLKQQIKTLQLVGIIIIAIGVISLGFIERKQSKDAEAQDKNKKRVFIGFMMAVVYSLLNAIGETLDGYYLDINNNLLSNVSEETIEIVANTSYELLFLIFAIILFAYIKLRKGKINIKTQGWKIGAACFETFGQFMHVYAMSGNTIIAGPIVSSVCIVSVILARIFLKEKLKLKQYISVFTVISGILILALAEVVN